MGFMKKCLSLFLVVLIVLTMTSCSLETTEQDEADVKDTEKMNSEFQEIVDSTNVVKVSSDLSFAIPTDIEYFTSAQYEELENFLYERGWDTVSAYYKGKYGGNARQLISRIEAEPVQTQMEAIRDWEEIVDENGNSTMKEVQMGECARTTVSYLLYPSNGSMETVRLTIIYYTYFKETGEVDFSEISQCCINGSDKNLSIDGYYQLVEDWQGGLKLYKFRVDEGLPFMDDEYYDVHTGSWGSDSADYERMEQQNRQKQKETWPASANESWDNLYNIGAHFDCDANTDVWYAVVGERVCYWIPTEKEWMTEMEVLFEIYYLTSTDGINYKLYKMIDGNRVWQLGFDRTLLSDGSLVVD